MNLSRMINQMLFVSATPNVYEQEHELAARRSRSSGLPDYWIRDSCVRPVEGQIDDLVGEIKKTIDAGNIRLLVTTLTKRMAEDLTDDMKEIGYPGALSCIQILIRWSGRRLFVICGLDGFDVLVGINLLARGTGHSGD